MECIACHWKTEEEKIYEDSRVFAVLAKDAISLGHLMVVPKNHYTILEQIPDYEISHIGRIINKLSIALFESLKIQGTNILIQNGISAHQTIPHFIIHIIPRMENDGLNFLWKPRQLSEEEMSTIEIQLKEQATGIGNFEKETPKPIDLDANKPIEIRQEKNKAGKSRDNSAEEEINYMIKQLEKMP